MAVKAKYTQPIQVVETQETRDVLKAISDRDEVSMAQVIRDCIDLGLEEKRRRGELEGL